MEHIAPAILPSMEGSWIGDVRGAIVGNAYVETKFNGQSLDFDIRVNAQGSVARLRGSLTPEEAQRGTLLLQEVTEPPKPGAKGQIILDQFTPEKMSGRWQFDTGNAGAIWVAKANTKGPSPSNMPSATDPAAGTSLAALVAKEETSPTVVLYRRDYEALIEILGRLIPGPAKVIITTTVNGHQVTQYADDFNSRRDLPRFVREMKFTISESGPPIPKSILINLFANQTKIFCQSDNTTWTTGAHEELRSVLASHSNWLRAQFQKYGLNLNSLILLIMIILMPDLPVVSRFVFVAFVIAVIALVVVFHRVSTRTTVYLDDTKSSAVARALPSIGVAVAGAAATAIAAKVYSFVASAQFADMLQKAIDTILH